MIEGCCPGTLTPLPAGFSERYSKEAAGSDDASQFSSREELLQLAQSTHEEILAKLASLSPEDLEGPSPEKMQGYAPTVGSVFNMIGSHWMMHCGQWVIVRRMAGKDVLI